MFGLIQTFSNKHYFSRLYVGHAKEMRRGREIFDEEKNVHLYQFLCQRPSGLSEIRSKLSFGSEN
jgi:hypothetical protein